MKKGIVWLLCLMLIASAFTGCAKPATTETTETVATASEETTEASAKVHFNAGTYKGISEGKEGKIEVEVTVNEDQITDIKVLAQRSRHI